MRRGGDPKAKIGMGRRPGITYVEYYHIPAMIDVPGNLAIHFS